jgi:hypothetical protein
MGACFQPMMYRYPQPPTFNVHLPPNTTPTVKVVFAAGDIEDLGPIPAEENEEVEIDAEHVVQTALPACGQHSPGGRGGWTAALFVTT